MDIAKAAEQLRNAAEKVAKEKGITVEQAWEKAIKDFKKKYGLS